MSTIKIGSWIVLIAGCLVAIIWGMFEFTSWVEKNDENKIKQFQKQAEEKFVTTEIPLCIYYGRKLVTLNHDGHEWVICTVGNTTFQHKPHCKFCEQKEKENK